MKIKAIRRVQIDSAKYDFAVEKVHNYFANGVLVHNCSATYFVKDGVFGVCSRTCLKYTSELGNRSLAFRKFILKLFGVKFNLDSNSHWVKVAVEQQIEIKLRRAMEFFHTDNIAIQGEIIGPGVGSAVSQSLTYKRTKNELYVFDIFVDNKFLDYSLFKAFMDYMGLTPVPLVSFALPPDKGEMLKYADGKSKLADCPREGLVWKPTHERMHPHLGRLMLKVISPEFQLKYNL